MQCCVLIRSGDGFTEIEKSVPEHRDAHSSVILGEICAVDCFLLLSAIVVGICQARSISMINPAPSETRQSVLLMAMIINAARLGGMYAGPLVLGCHFMFRYRRQCLLPGEWLWLSPLMMAGLCSIISKSVMTLSSSNLFPVSMYYMEIGAMFNSRSLLFVYCVRWSFVPSGGERRFGGPSILDVLSVSKTVFSGCTA